MSASISLRHPELSDAHARLRELAARAQALRQRAMEFAEEDLQAYAPVIAALRLPSHDPERARRLDAALVEAAGTPLELARVSAEVAALALEAAHVGAPQLRGDARAGAVLAEAACQAAAGLVAINLADRPHDERMVEVAELTDRAEAIRAQAL